MTSYASSLGGLVGKGITTVSTNSTKIQFWGLWHLLIGNATPTVSVQMLGQDCGDFTVAGDGSVTVPFKGTTFGGNDGVVALADLFTYNDLYNDAEQVTPVSVVSGSATSYLHIPVVIGTPYVSQGQRLRAATAADVQTPSGPGLGKLRRTHQFAALVKDAVVVSFGTSLTPTPTGNMLTGLMFAGGADPNSGSLATAAGYSGVYRQTLTATDDFDDMFCWQVDRPWPFAIMAVTNFLHAQDV